MIEKSIFNWFLSMQSQNAPLSAAVTQKAFWENQRATVLHEREDSALLFGVFFAEFVREMDKKFVSKGKKLLQWSTIALPILKLRI